MTKPKQPIFVNLLVLTILTVVIWIGYSVYSTFSSPTEITIPPEALQNFDPTLDAEGLTKLQQSIYLSEDELRESVAIVVEVPVETEEEISVEEDTDVDTNQDTEDPANEETES